MLQVGNPAVSKDFANREREVNTIMNALKKDNILLIAPRRYGKTSVMRRIQTLLGKDGYTVIFIDVHDVYTPQQFVIELAMGVFDMAKDKKSFVEKMKQFFSQKLKDLEFEISIGGLKVKFKRLLKEEIERNWKEEGRTVFMFIQSYFDNLVFVIDEFSECVHNMSKNEEVEQFLKWLRSMRAREDTLRFILGGSVSIDRVVKKVTALSAINDFRRVLLGGFDREAALCVVKKVFDEEMWEYTDEIGEKIVECIGVPSVPYFLSVFLSMIQEEGAENVHESFIEEIHNNSLMGAKGKHYFDYYVQRLKIYYEEERAAKVLLKELCQTGSISMDAAFNIFSEVTNKDYESFLDLISDLENDFYVNQTGDTLQFSSKVLRDWWRLYHV